VSVAVRVARGSDAAALAACWRELLLHHAALDPAFAVRDAALARLDAEVHRAIAAADSGVFVAESADALVGFCAVRLDRAPGALVEPARAVVTELSVVQALRRRGVGRALADAAFAWGRAQGASRAEVRVAARNAEAQAFWRALGFGDFVDVLDRRL
jgi:ribosomal protein S18 acetylase RimI-like enzyme